jgi:hypothetical protein
MLHLYFVILLSSFYSLTSFVFWVLGLVEEKQKHKHFSLREKQHILIETHKGDFAVIYRISLLQILLSAKDGRKIKYGIDCDAICPQKKRAHSITQRCRQSYKQGDSGFTIEERAPIFHKTFQPNRI